MFSKIFDYSKRSIEIIKSNPITLITVLMEFVLLAIIIFLASSFISEPEYPGGYSTNQPVLLFLVFLHLILALIIRAGKFNMIYRGVNSTEVTFEDFKEGIGYHYSQLLKGNIVIGILVLVSSLIILIPLVRILSILGLIIFVIAVLVITILLLFWETILVYEKPFRVMDAITESVSFAKNHLGFIILFSIIFGIIGYILERLGAITSMEPTNMIQNQGANFISTVGNLSGLSSISVVLLLTLISILFKLFMETFYFVVYHKER